MKFLNASIVRLVLIALIAVAACTGVACGGGSDGTGGRSIAGAVYSRAGGVIAGVKVTLLDTGDQGTTDENGEFSFVATKSDSGSSLKNDSLEELVFELDNSVFVDQATIKVKLDAVLVRIVFYVDEDTGRITLTLKEEFTQSQVDRGDSQESVLPERPRETGGGSATGDATIDIPVTVVVGPEVGFAEPPTTGGGVPVPPPSTGISSGIVIGGSSSSSGSTSTSTSSSSTTSSGAGTGSGVVSSSSTGGRGDR